MSKQPKDFDWDLVEGKGFGGNYTTEQKEKMEAAIEATLNSVTEKEVVKGIVVSKTDREVIINIGFKSDGLVSASEFRDMPDLKAGDEVEVYIENQEDANGQLTLSRKLAKVMGAWTNIEKALEEDTIINGFVKRRTKGGLIVDIFGIEAFLPGSQIDVKPIRDFDIFVGKNMEVKVVKINHEFKNVVVSHKVLIEDDLESQKVEIVSKLEKGQVLEGTVKNITDFGVFIDLGGVDGLLYITDISWGRVTHPNEVLENGKKLNVVVLDFDDEKKRISLGLKQLTPHPWDSLNIDIQEGAKVKGKVVNIEDYGAFLEILPGVEGLVHVSEITWSSQPINAKEFFKMGDEYEALVVTLDKEERKMSLSIKQMTEDPWDTIENKFPLESRHNGVVKNITPYGVFVELQTGIGGMIHISDLSWIKRFNHPSEFTKVGEPIEVTILSIDKENRKLALGHKQIEEDPWNTFESVFPIGSTHEGNVTKKDDKGATVQLQYGLEAYAPARHLRKENGSTVEADEILPFVIIEFDRNDKRIVVSHTRIWEQEKADEKETLKKEAKADAESTKKAVKNVQSKVEKSTLGDIDVLAALKDKMKKDEESK